MRALVIGASGLVGGNCLSYFRDKGWDTVGTHLSYTTSDTVYLDTTNLTIDNNKNFYDLDFTPDVIVHCGALTNVDYCEQHQEESYLKTVISAQNVVVLSQRYNSKLIYISTDYVFSGDGGPYTESAIPSPLNMYGQHKLLAEQIVQEQQPDNLIVRVTNVYGDEVRGKNFVSRIIDNTLSNKRLELPSDQFATPINALDIAKAIYLLVTDDKTGLYHLGSTDYCSRFQLASRVKKYVPNSDIDLIPKLTDELNQVAIRPKQSGLQTLKFLAEYPQFLSTNIDDYLSTKTHQLC